jgi:glycosyltransferase involved in cell wall biosynthesis
MALPRLALAIPKLDAAGPDRVYFDLLRAFDRDRFALTLIVHEAGGRYFDRLPPDVDVFVAEPRSRNRLSRRYPVGPMREALRRARPDVVMSTLRSILTVALASIGAPWRVVVRPANHVTSNSQELGARGLQYRFASWLGDRALSGADAVIAQSHDLAGDFAKRVGTRLSIDVISNPVDVELLTSQVGGAAGEVLGAPSIVAVGRLSPQKGFDVLIDAFARLQRTRPEAGLTILGEGPEREALEAQVRGLGLAAIVRLPGAVENPWRFMRAADLVVSSSRYEGFPNVVLEALALGCVVVAADCPGGTKDMMQDGENGWLVRSEDPIALAAGLERALSEALLIDREGRQEQVAAELGIDRIARRYERVFDSLVGRSSRSWD